MNKPFKIFCRGFIHIQAMLDWQFGLLCGLVPSTAMFLASVVLMRVEVSLIVEACFQNFCAGLILAAVAGELFPLVTDYNSKRDIFCGVSLGFTVGLCILYGIELLINTIANFKWATGSPTIEKNNGYEEIPEILDAEIWEIKPVQASLNVINGNRNHLKLNLVEISNGVDELQMKSALLLQFGLSEIESDRIAEEVDEGIHKLQYLVDKTRRHLEGAGGCSHLIPGSLGYLLLSEEKKLEIHFHLSEIKDSINHLVEHMDSKIAINIRTITEIHGHIEELSTQLDGFHTKIETVTRKWRRSRPFPDTYLGETIPLSLFLPVTIDAIVDGFLVGMTCALSRKGGLILAFANCLEMSFLGMAFSSRVTKCTGSSVFNRYFTVISPPVAMFLSSGLGACIGTVAKAHPLLFIGFVSFGIVALLSLVCNELILEAAEQSRERTWISLLVFLGVYIVFILNLVLPDDAA
jgi:hypothetical protein